MLTEIREQLEQIPKAVLWPSEFLNMLRVHRKEGKALGLSVSEMCGLVLKQGLLRRAMFTSPRYQPIVRYLRGNPSPYELALALKHNSFLCYQTALTLHALVSPTTNAIYVNEEQAPKPPTESITQDGINLAFRNAQRRSSYVFRFAGSRFILVSGKNTGNAGVIQMKAPDGGLVNVTDLERTLIDIVVRPAYACGPQETLGVYKKALSHINIRHMIELLRRFDYVYPYHQAIGFLLERAGRQQDDCDKFKSLGLRFDFYLDYQIKRPAYDKSWRLYYPPFMV